METEYLVELLTSVTVDTLRREEPDHNVRAELVSANSQFRERPGGIYTLQCGSGMAYAFDKSLDGNIAKYERILDESRKGLLKSEDPLLAGMFETYRTHGETGTVAFLLTRATNPRDTRQD